MDDADRELRDYFRSPVFYETRRLAELAAETSESDVEEEEQTAQQAPPSMSTSVKCNMHATVNDHSYFKDHKKSSMIMSDLGVDTPSDSGKCRHLLSCALRAHLEPFICDLFLSHVRSSSRKSQQIIFYSLSVLVDSICSYFFTVQYI